MSSTIGHGFKWVTSSTRFFYNNPALLKFYPVMIIALLAAILVAIPVTVFIFLLVVLLYEPLIRIASVIPAARVLIEITALFVGPIVAVACIGVAVMIVNRVHNAVLLALTHATKNALNQQRVSIRGSFQMFVDIQAEESGVPTEDINMRKWVLLLLLSIKTYQGVLAGPALHALSDHVRSVHKVFKRPIIISGEQESAEEIASQIAGDLYGNSEELTFGIYQAIITIMCCVGMLIAIILLVAPGSPEIKLIIMLVTPITIVIFGSAYSVFLSTVVRMVLYKYWETGECPPAFESCVNDLPTEYEITRD